MANDARTELFKSVGEENSKYTYFLLAAAGAAIGFAITQTKDAVLTFWMIPLGLAVLSWSASFFTGCRHLQQRQNLMIENFEYLRVKAGDHPQIPPHPQFVAEILQYMEDRRKNSGRCGAWQFRFLITGAIFYILWHAMQMYLRTFGL